MHKVVVLRKTTDMVAPISPRSEELRDFLLRNHATKSMPSEFEFLSLVEIRVKFNLI